MCKTIKISKDTYCKIKEIKKKEQRNIKTIVDRAIDSYNKVGKK